MSQVRAFLAPKRSFIRRYQILRAARYLAISSKKSLCALKKKLRRGPNSSTSRPRRRAHSTYSTPSYNVKASSCSAVDPASRIWYPLIEMVLNRGVNLEPNSKVSTTSLIEGAGGKMYSFCAMYSLRMSFWMVPEIFFQSAPCFSATTKYMAHKIEAGELMVMDTVVLSRSI